MGARGRSGGAGRWRLGNSVATVWRRNDTSCRITMGGGEALGYEELGGERSKFERRVLVEGDAAVRRYRGTVD